MSLTCWARSTVNIDRSTVNPDWVSNGLWRASGWAGLGPAGPDTWHAVTQPRHSHGPPLGRGPRLAGMSVAHGRPRRAGPWTVGWVLGGPSPPLSSLSVVHVHRVHGHVAGEGRCSPVSYRGGAPAGGELAVSPRGGSGVRLGRGKASPGHGDCVCGVKVAARAFQGAGHGERRLSSACRR